MESYFNAQEAEELYPIRLVDRLTFKDIRDVAEGKCAAIRIKEFCSKKICKLISNKILSHSAQGNFNKAPDIGRIGVAHFEIDNEEMREHYHQKAMEHTWQLRNIFDPYFSPVDKLRLLLEEVWPSGARLEIMNGRKCFVGICRIIKPSIELLAHNDRLDRDAPGSLEALSLMGQLSACIYIQVPDEGGGLRLWMSEPKNEEEYIKLKSGNYGIAMDKLGPPIHIIEPEEGDLLIFNIRKYHGVAPGTGKSRINVGAFIGYRSIGEPLTYWS